MANAMHMWETQTNSNGVREGTPRTFPNCKITQPLNHNNKLF